MRAASVKALGGGGAKELQSIPDRDAAPLASPFTSQTVPTMMWFKVGWLAGWLAPILTHRDNTTVGEKYELTVE